jgi:hypothetical protein
LRKSEEAEIEKKEAEVAKYSNENYLKIPIVMSDSDEYDLSSSVVRGNILKLGSGLLDEQRRKYEEDTVKSIGLSVYCYLSNLDYLIPGKKYGKRCSKLDTSLSEEIESVESFGISDEREGFEADADILNEEELGDYSIDLSNGELDDIPEKYRNIFIEIETYNMFNSETIKNEDMFDRIMEGLIGCDIHGRSDINYKNLKKFLVKIYDSGIYYILNDLCYFKFVKIEPSYCFIQDLLSNRKENINLLKDINLITTDQFNTQYLLNTKVDNIKKLSDDRNKYLGTINTTDSGGYRDNDGNIVKMEMVDEILGFLYDSERYSLYLYLIDKNQPVEGKKILVRLYSTIVEQKNNKVKEIFDSLNDVLADTIERSKRDTGPPVPPIIPPRLKRPKGSGAAGPKGPERPAIPPKGESQLLSAVKYTKQITNGDGNCFYNSVGILSSKYLRDENYESLPIIKKYDIQRIEQERVRTELATFMTDIYNVIQNIDKESSQYKDSSIIKYIIRNGKSNFKYVSTIRSPVGSKYYGTDSEIYFASLLYREPIVTVTGMSDVTTFNVFYWKYYQIGGIDFDKYLKQDESAIDIRAVLNFLSDSNEQLSCDLEDISIFLMYYPNSYFLVGGRGHWSYAINTELIGARKSIDSSVSSVGGSDSKQAVYNVRVTKKIKKNNNNNKSSSSSSKKTRKHKITRKRNKHNNHNKKNKKTIKYNREL